MTVSGKFAATRSSAGRCDELDIQIIETGDAAGTIIINGGPVPVQLRNTAVSNTNERNSVRKAGIALAASSVRALRRILLWPPRVLAARHDYDVLSGMRERELKDIGLTRSDVGDITALPSDANPTEFLAGRIEERRAARGSHSRPEGLIP
jgi:uncharacterized protein YjiS (DUF1127 family)